MEEGEREGEGERRRGRWRVESGSREKLSGVKRGRGNRRVRRGRKRLLETDVAREEESTEREKESTVE